jgi:hypothetical protein
MKAVLRSIATAACLVACSSSPTVEALRDGGAEAGCAGLDAAGACGWICGPFVRATISCGAEGLVAACPDSEETFYWDGGGGGGIMSIDGGDCFFVQTADGGEELDDITFQLPAGARTGTLNAGLIPALAAPGVYTKSVLMDMAFSAMCGGVSVSIDPPFPAQLRSLAPGCGAGPDAGECAIGYVSPISTPGCTDPNAADAGDCVFGGGGFAGSPCFTSWTLTLTTVSSNTTEEGSVVHGTLRAQLVGAITTAEGSWDAGALGPATLFLSF